ncbi:MAG TPA: hypothetical protein V6D08_18905 [Candidatus Obscuribacterales bacterium]
MESFERIGQMAETRLVLQLSRDIGELKQMRPRRVDFGDLQGPIDVPHNAILDLYVKEFALADLCVLGEFPDGRVISCRLAPGRIPAGQFKHIARLSGLRKLTLERVSLDVPAELAVLEKLPSLVELDMSEVDVGDETLAWIARARRLRKLILGPCQITATGLQFLKQLPLRDLRLHGCSVGDAGAAALKEIVTLRALRLTRAGMGNGGLAEIASLPRLVILELGGNKITDDGLVFLKAARTIERLNLMHTSISDTGAAVLGTFEQLRALSLEGTRVTDQGIKHLILLPHLEELDLSYTAVTPACLPLLKQMSSLKHVYLFETEVCEEDAVAMQQELPHVSINGMSPGSAC